MEGKLNHVFDQMTMPEELSDQIERSMQRRLRQKKRGRYVSAVKPGGKSYWSGALAACLVLVLLIGGGAWMLRGSVERQGAQGTEATMPAEELAEYTNGVYCLSYPRDWTVAEQENGSTVIFACPQLGRAALLVIEQTDAQTLQSQTDGKGFVIPSKQMFENLEIRSKEKVLLAGLEAGKVVFSYGEEQSMVTQYSLLWGNKGYKLTCNHPNVDTDVYLKQLLTTAESFRMVREEDRTATYQDSSLRIALPAGWTVEEQRGEDGRVLTFRDPEEKAALFIHQGEGWIVENMLDADGLRRPGEGDWKYQSVRRERTELAGVPAAFTQFISEEPAELREEYCVVVSGVSFIVDLSCPNEPQALGEFYPALDGMVRSLVLLPQEEPAFSPTQKDLDQLEPLCRILPDFEGDTSADGIFWWELLTQMCTEDTITVCSEAGQSYPETPAGRGEFANGAWGDPKGTMVKLGREQVERYVNEILGLELPQFAESDPAMGAGQWAVYNQGGFFYIGVAGQDGLAYLYSNSCTISNEYDLYSVVEFLMLEGEQCRGKVRFTIRPAARENGFIVCSKQTIRYASATVFCPNEQATDLVPVGMLLTEPAELKLVDALIGVGVLNKDVKLNQTVQQGKILTLDFNQALSDQVNATGTTGENVIIQCIVQTFLEAYRDVAEVVITVDGQTWESGHRIYDGPIGIEPI